MNLRVEAQSTVSPAMFVQWASYDRKARIIVDDEVRIAWSNAAAEAELGSAGSIYSLNGVLRFEDPARTRLLHEFVRRVAQDFETLCLPSSASGHLVFQAGLIGEIDGKRAVGVRFHDTRADQATAYADLGSVFGLTSKQREVMLLLMGGTSTEQITRTMGVSLETVRSHIKSIYQKLEVTSREGLFSKIAPFRL